ncbi:hypothetical protein DFS34DRAFT_683397 [Phlyctochytrium arcticum]|nr:hypothetical protein DFS34DRAFT_683397 [Phlyctochytrium arcticum]
MTINAEATIPRADANNSKTAPKSAEPHHFKSCPVLWEKNKSSKQHTAAIANSKDHIVTRGTQLEDLQLHAHISISGTDPAHTTNENHHALQATPPVNPRDLWIVDSAATTHMYCNKNEIQGYRPISKDITVGSNTTIPAMGAGTVRFNQYDIPVLYSMYILSDSTFYQCKKPQNSDLNAPLQTAPPLCTRTTQSTSARTTPNLSPGTTIQDKIPEKPTSSKETLWNHRFGHPSSTVLIKAKDSSVGLQSTFSPTRKLVNCEGCLYGQMKRQRLPTKAFAPSQPPKDKLEIIHVDLAGRYPTPSPKGNVFFIVIYDTFTHK